MSTMTLIAERNQSEIENAVFNFDKASSFKEPAN